MDVSVQTGRWSLLGGTQGGLIMGRTLRLLGIDPRRPGPDPGGLGALDAAAIAAGAGPAAGLAVTVVDGTLEFSLTGDVTPAVVWRSVVDAVTREAAALHETITAVVGPHTRIIAAGGWCASAMVLDAKRRFLGDITVTQVDEPGAFGAAIMAARAAGHLGPAGRLGGSTARDGTAAEGNVAGGSMDSGSMDSGSMDSVSMGAGSSAGGSLAGPAATDVSGVAG